MCECCESIWQCVCLCVWMTYLHTYQYRFIYKCPPICSSLCYICMSRPYIILGISYSLFHLPCFHVTMYASTVYSASKDEFNTLIFDVSCTILNCVIFALFWMAPSNVYLRWPRWDYDKRYVSKLRTIYITTHQHTLLHITYTTTTTTTSVQAWFSTWSRLYIYIIYHFYFT